jgi:hypothetical protein
VLPHRTGPCILSRVAASFKGRGMEPTLVRLVHSAAVRVAQQAVGGDDETIAL